MLFLASSQQHSKRMTIEGAWLQPPETLLDVRQGREGIRDQGKTYPVMLGLPLLPRIHLEGQVHNGEGLSSEAAIRLGEPLHERELPNCIQGVVVGYSTNPEVS